MSEPAFCPGVPSLLNPTRRNALCHGCQRLYSRSTAKWVHGDMKHSGGVWACSQRIESESLVAAGSILRPVNRGDHADKVGASGGELQPLKHGGCL